MVKCATLRWQKYCCYDIASMYDNHVIQIAQLSQRDSATGWPKVEDWNWETIFTDIIGLSLSFNHCDVIDQQSNWIFFKFLENVCNSWTLRALMVNGWAATDIRMDELSDNTRTDAKTDNGGRTDGPTNSMVGRVPNRSISYVLITWKSKHLQCISQHVTVLQNMKSSHYSRDIARR